MPTGWTPELMAGTDARFRVRYELAGLEDAPLLVAMGGISADRHVCANLLDPAPGWWRKLAGPGLAIDTNRWRLLAIDFLGSPGTCESMEAGDPSTESGDSSKGSSPDRTHLTPGDQADAVAAALRHLGVERAHRMLGASYGGMVALAMGIRHPAHVDGVVLIGAAHRGHPQGIGIHAVQRWIVEFALRHGRGSEGVALARALAFTTYKSAAGLDARFPHDWEWEDGAPVYAVGRYLEKQGREFAARFEAETYLTLSASVDLCDLRPEELGVPAWLIGWEEDTLVPPWLLRETASRIGAPSHLRVLNSDAGHDAFLLHAPDYEEALRTSLSELPQGMPRAAGDAHAAGRLAGSAGWRRRDGKPYA